MSTKLPSAKTAFWMGFRVTLPFILILAPAGLLFGVLSVEAGLNLAETMALSFLVLAGAAQFTAVSLIADNAPSLIVILTAVAVNLRMAMYSAALVPYLGTAPLRWRMFLSYGLSDQTVGVSLQKFEDAPDYPVFTRCIFMFGSICVVAPIWYGFSMIGVLAGAAIPPEYALDFALPITFIALFSPALRSLPHVVAALTSVTVALLAANVPYSLGILLAGIIAMMAGAECERQITRWRA